MLARRREFGVLRHLGMTRRQIGAMLATEGFVVSAIGLAVGLALGFAISLILIHVVNRQSFHWGMELSLPWPALAGFAARAARAVDADGARERAPGDGRGRRARGEGRLVIAIGATFLALPLAAFAMRCARIAARVRSGGGRLSRASSRGALAFPRDHGSHPEFRTEWWYVTGWVNDAAGNEYGVQVTFFRNRPRVAEANPSAFAPRQLVFAHAALADPRPARLCTTSARRAQGFGLAGADEETTRVWIDDWSLARDGDATSATIAAREFALDLALRADAAAAAARRRAAIRARARSRRRRATTTASRSSR